MPRNQIAWTQKMTKRSVQAVAKAAEAASVGWADAEVYAALFPNKVHDRAVNADPDWKRVDRELARVGVTPKGIHAEHRDETSVKGEPFMSYDRFRRSTVRKQATSHVGLEAGRMMKVDWAGRPRPTRSSPACPSAACPALSRRRT